MFFFFFCDKDGNSSNDLIKQFEQKNTIQFINKELPKGKCLIDD